MADAAAAAAALPGMTRTFGNPGPAIQPITTLAALPRPTDRKVVLLATATITFDNLFCNGLFQNVFILYRMFEAMGYHPIMVINERPKDLETVPPMLRPCRLMTTEQIILEPRPVIALIEIGMSIDPLLREFVKMLGGRLAKLYLGNILNIDVETPIFYPGMHFAHHVIEKIDRVWTSPHYGQHAEYAAFINHVTPPADLADMIAPYVWDPCIIRRDGELALQWKPRGSAANNTVNSALGPRRDEAEDVFVIMEPNISFQKSSLVPLMALERWYRAGGKTWKGTVIVINGERMENTPHFSQSIAPTLDLIKDGRVQMKDRMDMITVMRTWPSATFVCHQFNNEYNYMALELITSGFPVVHNSPTWAPFGYTYAGNDIAAAAKQIEAAHSGHADCVEVYKAHAAALLWRHSPYNPDVHRAWEALLKK